MKSILILFLLGFTFSYNRIGAANYALKYCNNYNPNYNKYSQQNIESVNFVSQCISIGGGQDFKGCEGRDDKGMFKYAIDLEICLMKKRWKRTAIPKKGIPMLYVHVHSYAWIIIDDKVIDNKITYCSHIPDRCEAKGPSKIGVFYSP